jgi:hypothetical protein
MKRISCVVLMVLVVMSMGCSPSPKAIADAIVKTQSVWTPVPTQTPYPSQTPKIVNVIKVFTPTPNINDTNCTPIKNLNYSDSSNMRVLLQAYVSGLPDVKSVSSTIGERLYSNTISSLIFVSYIAKEDSQVYSKRYIVYYPEFGWKKAVYSIDGQCWIDPPHY